MKTDETKLREQIREVGRRLYQARLAVAKSGNLSCRVDEAHILITATGTFLGALKDQDIVKVRLSDNKTVSSEAAPSSELPLHGLVYMNFPAARVVVHCHPPLVNGYFAGNDSLEAHTFETRFYLGALPVVRQETPTVTDPQPVIEALKAGNLVVLKNHGTVAMGEDFEAALSLTEALEEAVLVAAVARLFKQGPPAPAGAPAQDGVSRTEPAYPMFSREHVEAIVELVNKDPFIAQKGQELDLTVKLAIRLDQDERAYKFNFEKGRIVKLDLDADAPFVISAPVGVWEMVFVGKLDPFVAVTQGKMKLQGQLGQLSRWYVPFSRLFELFKQVKIK